MTFVQISIFSFCLFMLSVKRRKYSNFNWKSVVLKSKFLGRHILYIYKNHALPFWRFLNLITRAQLVEHVFCSTYHCEQFFSKMKRGKRLRSQLSNNYLSYALLLWISSLSLIVRLFCDWKKHKSRCFLNKLWWVSWWIRMFFNAPFTVLLHFLMNYSKWPFGRKHCRQML